MKQEVNTQASYKGVIQSAGVQNKPIHDNAKVLLYET